MNSRNSVNETNLVNLSADLTTLNQLDTKESLLSFPFDHLYACHSGSLDRRQSLQLDKEVEISTHCVIAEEKDLLVNTGTEINRLTDRLSAAEKQNKKLKDLLIYHLDLIQQQNEVITKKEKVFQALRQENEILKTKVNLKERRVPVNQRLSTVPTSTVTSASLLHVPASTVPPTVVKTEPGTSPQIMFNSFTELLLPDNRTNSYILKNDMTKPKPFKQGCYPVNRGTDTNFSRWTSNVGVGVPSILDRKLNCNNFKMIDNKRSLIKKDIVAENRSEPLYTITSHGGNPVIQKIQRNRRRTTSSLGSLSRMTRPPIKVDPPQTTKMFEEDKSLTGAFSVNKKSKMINTYGKSRNTIPKRPTQFTGSLSDRLQLIDTTPTGEDPYQLGEADMREQSPIPKLMLQKTNHGRMKICTDTMGESTAPTRRIYDSMATETITRPQKKIKLDRYNLSTTFTPVEIKKEPIQTKTLIVEEPDLDIVKTETEIDWRAYTTRKQGTETSLCDFSYGENSNNLATQIMDSVEFHDLFTGGSCLNLESLNTVDYTTEPDKDPIDKSKRRAARTTSLIGANVFEGEIADNRRGGESKRGRKRALSTTGFIKGAKQNAPKSLPPPVPVPTQVSIPGPKPKIIRGKASCRGKKFPVPGMITMKAYHTHVGDPDLSWYLGLDPDVKMEDVDPTGDSKVSTVEVPRWREKLYASCYSLEGTENLDDKVFEKRHQKLEAEERRQLRWHMRRIREQRHVDRLRQRQRDPWCSGNASHYQPSVYTIWPQPQRDVRLIEITDTLPVMAFGEELPDLRRRDFMLPWVRTSKALKRSKRSKTLH